MNGEKSARDVQSCTVCFVQINLLEFEILGRTKCWLQVSVCFSGSGMVYQGLLQTSRLCNNKTVSVKAGALAGMVLTLMWQRYLLGFWSISDSSEMSGECPEQVRRDQLLLLAIFSRVISVPAFNNSVFCMGNGSLFRCFLVAALDLLLLWWLFDQPNQTE